MDAVWYGSFLISILMVTVFMIIFSRCNHTELDQHEKVEAFASVRIGSNSYKVHEDLENPYKAAELMDQLNVTARTFIDRLKSKFTPDKINNIHPQYRDRVTYCIDALQRNYRSANLEENIPERSGGDTSYVIDKGEVFAMCLRDPHQNNKLDDKKLNELTFVLIHELTHLGTQTYGHDDLFWNNFKFLLQEAVKFGLYKPVDYKKVGSPYCGIVISYSPLYDPKLVEYHI